ncbi:MAG: tocopherol cyclase family protein [Phormidesmis sp.]
MTPNSSLQTPHSGYHWQSSTARFFEGWYFRLTLPDCGQTFAFMYSIDDPAGGTAQSGGVAQILGPNESYCCRTFPDVNQFWAWPHRLGLGHMRWRSLPAGESPDAQPDRYLPPEVFTRDVKEGYQATAFQHQGRLLSPSGEPEAEWHYQTKLVAGWGASTQQATAGWMSYLPVFEPGWQVMMAHGLATGQMHWRGKDYVFENAPAYAEKNWGGAFPEKWFWLQCNAFEREPSLSITAAGGIREVLVWTENVAIIGIHHKGQFYEFASFKTDFTWQIDPWGFWQLTARSHQYRAVLTGIAKDEGAYVRVPTREGMQFLCRDTTHGELRVQLWAISDNRLIVDATSQLAGLEVGGGPWDERWVKS